jgi:hypothetical protein
MVKVIRATIVIKKFFVKRMLLLLIQLIKPKNNMRENYYLEETRTLTYDELKKEVDEEWEILSEEEKNHIYLTCSPPFKMYVLSSMKKGQRVQLNEHTCEYTIS